LLVTACGASHVTSSEPTAPTLTQEREDAASPSLTASLPPTPIAPGAASGVEAGAEVSTGSILIGEIAAPKTFNPRPTIAALVPDLLSCYRKVRASAPSLRGKLKLRLVVNESGVPQSVAGEPGGGAANDPALISCLGETLKSATFPKPGGTAIVIVHMVFRP
jgi:hypothetical protein